MFPEPSEVDTDIVPILLTRKVRKVKSRREGGVLRMDIPEVSQVCP